MGLCTEVSSGSPIGNISLFSFVFAMLELLAIAFILWWQRQQRVLAAKGAEEAARLLILPIYSWILWFFAAEELLQAIANIVAPLSSIQFQSNSITYRCPSSSFLLHSPR